jgi:hypothetical protein
MVIEVKIQTLFFTNNNDSIHYKLRYSILILSFKLYPLPVYLRNSICINKVENKK